jgi:hypothetical protein
MILFRTIPCSNQPTNYYRAQSGEAADLDGCDLLLVIAAIHADRRNTCPPKVIATFSLGNP